MESNTSLPKAHLTALYRDTVLITASPPMSWGRARNLTGFWMLGLCNNFAYVVMLSAAYDILTEEEKAANGTNTTTVAPISTSAPLTLMTSEISPNNKTTVYLECNKIGTGAILLADILPTLLIKLTAPWYMQKIKYWIRVVLTVLFALASFLIVGLSEVIWANIFGVVCASISAGVGEITFLSLSTFYHRDVVSTWSSGTGGAGIFGALAYAAITALVSPRVTLYIFTVIPVIMGLSYFLLLTSYEKTADLLPAKSDESMLIKKELTLLAKLGLVKPLLKYMIPLTTVYFCEYFINQGLHELLYFYKIWIVKSEQYRWYQVIYQLGVFISRSSVNCFQIKKLWILPILQLANLVVLLTQVYFRYIPNIWIIFAIILFEGLLGGAAYVNTFYRMSQEIPSEHREFSLGVATLGDSIGIAAAGAVAIPSHNRLCDLRLKM
ncbi:battenin-like isoform X3 [Gigantopelta aegis]|uniref:battenin-like isoform X3 n=1 Tax=Gigantopelta aegis TaxID=1735272 RepID=UPI001B888247|nr:battenin-like isoform X3 [Gigantopelta aegis]